MVDIGEHPDITKVNRDGYLEDARELPRIHCSLCDELLDLDEDIVYLSEFGAEGCNHCLNPAEIERDCYVGDDIYIGTVCPQCGAHIENGSRVYINADGECVGCESCLEAIAAYYWADDAGLI